jgi:hypothetical protein
VSVCAAAIAGTSIPSASQSERIGETERVEQTLQRKVTPSLPNDGTQDARVYLPEGPRGR